MVRAVPAREPLRPVPAAARTTLAVVVALLLGVAGSPAAAGQSVVGQAAAAEVGVDTGAAPAYLRTAHLVSDLGTVDVRLSAGGTAREDLTAREDDTALAEGASYGAVGAYAAVAPESYAVSVRRAGEDLGDDPLLARALTLEPGRAYTVVAVGQFGSAALQLLEDDLTPPSTGQAEVRLVSAAPGVRVSVDGTQVVELLQPARTSDYVEVPAGKHGITVDDGTTSTVQDVGLVSRSSYTLFVTPGADGALQVQTVLDQAATEVVPVGGIETGGGWLAQEVLPLGSSAAPAVLGGAAVLVVALLGLPVLRRRTARPLA